MFQCKFCPFSRIRSDVVARHEQSHTQSKVACEKCGRNMAKTSLKRHLNNCSENYNLESEPKVVQKSANDETAGPDIATTTKSIMPSVKVDGNIYIIYPQWG